MRQSKLKFLSFENFLFAIFVIKSSQFCFRNWTVDPHDDSQTSSTPVVILQKITKIINKVKE